MFDSSMSAATIAAKVNDLQKAAGFSTPLLNPEGRGTSFITLTGRTGLACSPLHGSCVPYLPRMECNQLGSMHYGMPFCGLCASWLSACLLRSNHCYREGSAEICKTSLVKTSLVSRS